MRHLPCGAAAALLLLAGGAAEAQRIPPSPLPAAHALPEVAPGFAVRQLQALDTVAPPRRRARAWKLLPAAFGSIVGLPVGAIFGASFHDATGCCYPGGDDPGLSEALLGAAIGASVGSAVGASVMSTREEPISLSLALLGGALGFVPAAFLGAISGEAAGPLVGFGVFGVTHAAVTTAFGYRRSPL